MIDTKLILLEGPPGSGKTTTAQKLTDAISASGMACQCFWEWSTDHPIPIGDDLHLGQVIKTSIAREDNMLQQWQQFAHTRQSQPLVTVLESRFWQTSVMLEYVAGRSVEGVLASNLRVINAIQVLKPVLIYFAIDDPRAFATRTMQLKDKEWELSHLPGTWTQHIFDAFDGQRWAMERGLNGLPAMLMLFEEWAGVTEQLYDRLPFPKIKIHNPHVDWTATMQQLRRFIELK